jgi:hypothetical protein
MVILHTHRSWSYRKAITCAYTPTLQLGMLCSPCSEHFSSHMEASERAGYASTLCYAPCSVVKLAFSNETPSVASSTDSGWMLLLWMRMSRFNSTFCSPRYVCVCVFLTHSCIEFVCTCVCMYTHVQTHTYINPNPFRRACYWAVWL